MSINTLAEKTLKASVDTTMGAGVEVQYKTAEKPKETVRCFRQSEIDEKIDKASNLDYIYFHAMKLDSEPKHGDKLTFNGKTYSFDSCKNPVQGLYDIVATVRKNKRGRR